MNRKVISLLISIMGVLYGQFADVTVTLDSRRLMEQERQNLQGLEQSIQQFYLASPWEREISDLEIYLEIQLVFESTVTIGNDRYFQAQMLISNHQDQRYLVRNVVFPYTPGRSVGLSPIYDPLSSLLEFYAYIVIAGELDNYGMLAGSSYYTLAANLANLGQIDPYTGQGWVDRLRLAEELATNQELRRAKAYFYQALDGWAAEEPDSVAIANSLNQFYRSIQTIVEREGQERNTSTFLSGNAEEIAELLHRAGLLEELAGMIVLNPDSEVIYRNYLEGDSEP